MTCFETSQNHDVQRHIAEAEALAGLQADTDFGTSYQVQLSNR
jgi:hypothetical protein